MVGLGNKIINAVSRGKALNLEGLPIYSGHETFSMTNPYILEALPETLSCDMVCFEGKKLKTVCRILNKPKEYIDKLTKRFKSFCSKHQIQPKSKGFTEEEITNLNNKIKVGDKIARPVDNAESSCFIEMISPKVGSHFDAHGISKDSINTHLDQLNQLLTKGIDKSRNFHSAGLAARPNSGAGVGTAGSHATLDGSFVIVSGKDKSLLNDGIEYVIVNASHYNIIQDLAKRFPHIKFVKADVKEHLV